MFNCIKRLQLNVSQSLIDIEKAKGINRNYIFRISQQHSFNCRRHRALKLMSKVWQELVFRVPYASTYVCYLFNFIYLQEYFFYQDNLP